jgi:hypothetical protein
MRPIHRLVVRLLQVVLPILRKSPGGSLPSIARLRLAGEFCASLGTVLNGASLTGLGDASEGLRLWSWAFGEFGRAVLQAWV